jgi:peptidoglycan/xylan/chitin deacetylase (PgdA/CDA1 family)
MRISIGRARKWARRVLGRLEPTGLVLMYHRIGEAASDPWGLCVSPENFAEQLEVLRGQARPMHIRTLSEAVRSHRVPRNTLAITFDDGYVDNLEHARPALEKQGMPATVFVATGYIGGTREYWWDDLERILLQPGQLPETLDLRVGHSEERIEVGAARILTEEQLVASRGWRLPAPAPTPRHAFYHRIWQRLYESAPADRPDSLTALAAWTGVTTHPRPSVRPMTETEIASLGSDGLIEIGGHSVTHPSLPNCLPATQRHEIFDSRRRLEAILNRPVASFAYPHGDHDASTEAVVREAGYTGACTTQHRAVRNRTDPYRLPRCVVGNWGGDTFARKLAEYSRC